MAVTMDERLGYEQLKAYEERWASVNDHYPASHDGLSYEAAVNLADEAGYTIQRLLTEIRHLQRDLTHMTHRYAERT